MTPLTLFDWLVLALVLVSLLLGAWRGLIYEVLTLAGWVLAFFAAQQWASTVAMQLPMSGSGAGLRHAAAFALVFIGVVLGTGLVAALLRRVLGVIGLRPIDRVLGAGFGMLRALALLLALGLIAHWTPLHRSDFWRLSLAAPYIDHAVRMAQPWFEERSPPAVRG